MPAACQQAITYYAGCAAMRDTCALEQGIVCAMDTTKAIATLLVYADRHHPPASFVAELWHLRAEPSALQAERLHQLYAAMDEGRRAALARSL